MKMRILKVDMSIEDWTKYLYYNIRIQKYGSEFYHKINWDILFNNLKKYGFYAKFLKYWYKTKREYSKEKANDFFNELYKSLSKRVTLNSFDVDNKKSYQPNKGK
jgi:hypothetical protein